MSHEVTLQTVDAADASIGVPDDRLQSSRGVPSSSPFCMPPLGEMRQSFNWLPVRIVDLFD
jgi:hypothetical protein